MFIVNVNNREYDDVMLRRIVQRSSIQFQTYQVYRKNKQVLQTSSAMWTVSHESGGLALISCSTNTRQCLIVPTKFNDTYLTRITPTAFQTVSADEILMPAEDCKYLYVNGLRREIPDNVLRLGCNDDIVIIRR